MGDMAYRPDIKQIAQGAGGVNSCPRLLLRTYRMDAIAEIQRIAAFLDQQRRNEDAEVTPGFGSR